MGDNEDVADPRQLDIEVATRLMGFAWVEWNQVELAGAPLASPGRFLARSSELTAHLLRPARLSTPESHDCLTRVPRYSTEIDQAMRVAARAGLVEGDELLIRREADGRWIVDATEHGISAVDRRLATALCLAALRNAETQPGSR